jgi:hypothetical protein
MATQSQISIDRYADGQLSCQALTNKQQKDACMKLASSVKVGKVNYMSDAGRAAIKKFHRENRDKSCSMIVPIIELMALAPKDTDYCNKIPKQWTEECVDR